MSTSLVGPRPAGARKSRWEGRQHLGPYLLALVALVFLGGCATGHPRANLLHGFGLHSRPASFRSAKAAGGAGGFPEHQTDSSPVGRTPPETSPLLVVIESEEVDALLWEGTGEGAPAAPPTCGGVAMPPGWPDLSSSDEVLLAPLLACTPAEFVQAQQWVDMPRLVEQLEDWSAVRLGALGPVREDAAAIINRMRAAFLVEVTRERGLAEGEVFALFLIHSAFGDELRQVLTLLAGDRRLGQTLGKMRLAREELERRGLKLSDYEDRPEHPLEDGARGALGALGEAFTPHEARNALATKFIAQRGHLPPPYQQALDEVVRAEMEAGFSPGNLARGILDEATFGIPLGFYGLAAGTGHGLYSLSQGRYEQAARGLTPAALMVALYASGKGLRALSDARGVPGAGSRLLVPELRARLVEVVSQLEARLSGDAMEELARYIQANREAGRLVAVGGPEAAIALHEARGDVARAQVWLSQAKPQRAGLSAARGGAGKSSGGAAALVEEAAGPAPKTASAGKLPGSVSSLVDETAGLTQEVVEAKLVRVELESTGPRMSRDAGVLESQLPALDAPPPEARGHPLWSEYVAYCETRLAELKKGMAVEAPLWWAGYRQMRGQFARGLAFERAFVELLRVDAALPRAQRRFLQDFNKPRIEMYVGVKKPGTGLRFADVLIIEEGELAGPLPRVETFSFKSRNLSGLKPKPLEAQIKADAREALRYYGETLNIRRPSLELLDKQVPVHRVRLIYEGGGLKPKNLNALGEAVEAAESEVPGVEVLFQ